MDLICVGRSAIRSMLELWTLWSSCVQLITREKVRWTNFVGSCVNFIQPWREFVCRRSSPSTILISSGRSVSQETRDSREPPATVKCVAVSALYGHAAPGLSVYTTIMPEEIALRFSDCTEICVIVEGADHCTVIRWLKRVIYRTRQPG